jgi:probable addiction module antidote protein
MSKLKNYQAWKLKKLSNPVFAANYLNEIEKSSPELVLSAIQNVVRAREVSAIAKEAGVAREHIYRAFTEQGNPTISTFREVLKAVGVKFHFEPIELSIPPFSPPSPTQNNAEQGSMSGTSQVPEFGVFGEGNDNGLNSVVVDQDMFDFMGGMGQSRKAPRSSEYGREREERQSAFA